MAQYRAACSLAPAEEARQRGWLGRQDRVRRGNGNERNGRGREGARQLLRGMGWDVMGGAKTDSEREGSVGVSMDEEEKR